MSRTLRLEVERRDPPSAIDLVFTFSPRAPIAFYSSLFGPWTGTYLSLYFSVRARAVASLVTAILGITFNFLMGWFLDSKVRIAFYRDV